MEPLTDLVDVELQRVAQQRQSAGSGNGVDQTDEARIAPADPVHQHGGEHQHPQGGRVGRQQQRTQQIGQHFATREKWQRARHALNAPSDAHSLPPHTWTHLHLGTDSRVTDGPNDSGSSHGQPFDLTFVWLRRGHSNRSPEVAAVACFNALKSADYSFNFKYFYTIR